MNHINIGVNVLTHINISEHNCDIGLSTLKYQYYQDNDVPGVTKKSYFPSFMELFW